MSASKNSPTNYLRRTEPALHESRSRSCTTPTYTHTPKHRPIQLSTRNSIGHSIDWNECWIVCYEIDDFILMWHSLFSYVAQSSSSTAFNVHTSHFFCCFLLRWAKYTLSACTYTIESNRERLRKDERDRVKDKTFGRLLHLIRNKRETERIHSLHNRTKTKQKSLTFLKHNAVDIHTCTHSVNWLKIRCDWSALFHFGSCHVSHSERQFSQMCIIFLFHVCGRREAYLYEMIIPSMT